MVSEHDPFADYLVKQFGNEVAAEFPIISRVLPRVADDCQVPVLESDYETFCRARLAKREEYKERGPDEPFEQLRLLNMLYERALHYCDVMRRPEFYSGLEAAKSSEVDQSEDSPDEELDLAVNAQEKLRAIVQHLDETIDNDVSGAIGVELHRLYDFMLSRLDDTDSLISERATEVSLTLREIYLGYLELEIRADAEDYFHLRAVMPEELAEYSEGH
ncbi:MAG: flagellar protein FliS [Bdellovibrionales bacterium]|nr:flagellar protein FliS [Bdellovibrionales bacterium]